MYYIRCIQDFTGACANENVITTSDNVVVLNYIDIGKVHDWMNVTFLDSHPSWFKSHSFKVAPMHNAGMK